MPRAKLFNKDDILHKAMHLFWEKGYHATSIQDLVAHLGINRASLYDTFGGKKSLFDQSLELYCCSNKETTLQFLNNQTSVKGGLKKLFERLIENASSDTDKKGCFVVNSTTQMIPQDNDVKKIVSNNKENFESIFYNFILKGQESGEIAKDKDLKVITTLIYTLFSGISVIAKVEPKQEEFLSTVSLVLSLLD